MTLVALLLSFLVSNGLLMLIPLAAWWLCSSQPNLSRRLARIRQVVSRHRRVARARVELERARLEHAIVLARLGAIRELRDDASDAPDPTAHVARAITFGAATVVLFEADAVLMALLNASSGLFGLGPAAWALLGPWIAAGVCTLLHALVVAAIGDDDRPDATINRARVGALITGVVVVAGTWAALSGRGMDMDPESGSLDVVLWGLWILTLGLATCGAFTAVVASVSFARAHMFRRLALLETLDERYRSHLSAVTSEVLSQAAGTALDGSRGGRGNGAVSPTLSASLVLVFVLIASIATGQPSSGRAPGADGPGHGDIAGRPPRWLTASASPVSGECEALLDVSGSIGPKQRTQAADAFGRMLPLVLEAYDCRVMRLSAFSGDAPFQPIEEFPVPPAPTAPLDCDHVQAPARRGGRGMVQAMYPFLAAHEKQAAQATCRAASSADAARAADARRQAATEIAVALTRLGRTAPRGACTGVYQAAARALQRSRHVLVLTDGDSSCGWYRQADGSPLSITAPSATLLFLLVPGESDQRQAGRGVLDRVTASLEAVFPSATSRLLTEATPAFWRRLPGRSNGTPTATAAPAVSITVRSPMRHAAVGHRPVVEGSVAPSEPEARIVVVVHPFETPDQFWVQEIVSADARGNWTSQVHIGRPGSIDVGKKFEIRAVLNPSDTKLAQGDVLGSWPAGETASDTVEIIRTR